MGVSDLARHYRFCVVSAHKPDFDEATNRARDLELGSLLRDAGLTYIAAEGSWEGRPESSYVVQVPRDVDLIRVLGWASYFGQPFVLVVNEDSWAYLNYVDSNVREPVGRWRRLHTAEARQAAGNWTRIGENFYAAEQA